MRTKELGGGRFALVFDKGDEPMSELERFARDRGLTAASFTGIGAFEEVVLGYFDRDTKQYAEIPLREQVEVLSLTGDVAVATASRRFTPTSSSASATAQRTAATSSARACGRRWRSS